MQFDLKSEINIFLESKEQKRKERDYFYISELGKSKKEIYKNWKSSENKIDSKLQRIFDVGNDMHKRYFKYLLEMRMLICAEIDVICNDLIHGRCDAIITDKKKNYVLELKSCSQWTFVKLITPIKEHELQLLFYCYFLNIKDGIILYENKDNSEIKCFEIELTNNKKELIEKYIEELKKLKEDIKNGIEPEDEPIKLEDLEYG